VRFWAFLGEGSSKTPQKYVHKKFMSEASPKKIDNLFYVLFLVFVCFFGRVFGCFSVMGVQKHYKNLLQKNRVEKCLPKNRQKNPKPIFLDFFNHVFGRFSVLG
jgi:hypothetical protein